jgi:hypothetical protein
MYRFVERERYEGQRYRIFGITRISLDSLKHLHKVGNPQYIKGYSFISKGIKQTAVIVRGNLGYIRFGGFSWGYWGEGPNGLKQLFDRLNLDVDPVALGNWMNSERRMGEHWRITLDRDGEISELKLDEED